MLPQPDIINLHYGAHGRQVFDLYLAESATPAPLVFFIHGGGFRAGDKSTKISQIPVEECLKNGISVAAINYRFIPEFIYPSQVEDAAYALQYIRHNAAQWNIDKSRIAASGGSAGSGLSLWLAFHPDLANPDSIDSVKHESTRLKCAIVFGAQHTYDARVIKNIIPGNTYESSALKAYIGLPETFNWDKDHVSDEMDTRIKESSPNYWLTADAPPVYVKHAKRHEVPGQIHHPNFGRELKKEMAAVKVKCIQRVDDEYNNEDGFHVEFIDFLKEHLI